MQHEMLVVRAFDARRSAARPGEVPSVVTTIACVSPRVNSAEPCVRGRTPTSQVIGRIWSGLAAVDAVLVFRNRRTHNVLLELFQHGTDLLLGEFAVFFFPE